MIEKILSGLSYHTMMFEIQIYFHSGRQPKEMAGKILNQVESKINYTNLISKSAQLPYFQT